MGVGGIWHVSAGAWEDEMAGRETCQIRRFHPKRGSVMETFRVELREVWRVIVSSKDPLVVVADGAQL